MKQFPLCAFILFCSVSASLAQQERWPNTFVSVATPPVSLKDAGLSQDEVGEIKRIALKTTSRKCRETLDQIGPDWPNQKLRVRILIPSRVVLVEGGGDWEDRSDDCFLGTGMNVVLWVIQFSTNGADVLLQTTAVRYQVIDSVHNGRPDVVTSVAARPGHSRKFELVWWRFNGRKYVTNRCAAELLPKSFESEGATPEQFQKAAKVSEHPCK